MDEWWKDPQINRALEDALDAAGWRGLTVGPFGVRIATAEDDQMTIHSLCIAKTSRVRKHKEDGFDICVCGPAGAYEVFVRGDKTSGFLPIGEKKGDLVDIRRQVGGLGDQLRQGLLGQKYDKGPQPVTASCPSQSKKWWQFWKRLREDDTHAASASARETGSGNLASEVSLEGSQWKSEISEIHFLSDGVLKMVVAGGYGPTETSDGKWHQRGNHLDIVSFGTRFGPMTWHFSANVVGDCLVGESWWEGEASWWNGDTTCTRVSFQRFS